MTHQPSSKSDVPPPPLGASPSSSMEFAFEKLDETSWGMSDLDGFLGEYSFNDAATSNKDYELSTTATQTKQKKGALKNFENFRQSSSRSLGKITEEGEGLSSKTEKEALPPQHYVTPKRTSRKRVDAQGRSPRAAATACGDKNASTKFGDAVVSEEDCPMHVSPCSSGPKFVRGRSPGGGFGRRNNPSKRTEEPDSAYATSPSSGRKMVEGHQSPGGAFAGRLKNPSETSTTITAGEKSFSFSSGCRSLSPGIFRRRRRKQKSDEDHHQLPATNTSSSPQSSPTQSPKKPPSFKQQLRSPGSLLRRKLQLGQQ